MRRPPRSTPTYTPFPYTTLFRSRAALRAMLGLCPYIQGGSMKKLTTAAGAPVVDNQNIQTAGPRGPALLQDVWLLEKLAHFDREVIPERRMHAKGAGAYGTFTVTHDITKYTRAKLRSEAHPSELQSLMRTSYAVFCL